MARELRRLLIEPSRLPGTGLADARVRLQPEEEHYLSRVLRLRSGDRIAVIDGCGGLWQALLGEGGWLENLQPSQHGQPQLGPELSLAMALPRQEVELVWRMACELGIDRLQPLSSDRSPVRERRPAEQRWQSVLREATEQCERLWLPVLEPIRRAGDWLSQNHPDQIRLLATTRRDQLPALETALERHHGGCVPSSGVWLAIGPEGGWSPEEEQLAEASGWQPVSLGETILRCSTAAVAASARLVAWRLSCASCRGPSP